MGFKLSSVLKLKNIKTNEGEDMFTYAASKIYKTQKEILSFVDKFLAEI